MKTPLIIITGLHCTGKTVLSHHLEKEFKYPLISKDSIKEILFDELGYDNVEWTEKLSKVTYSIMFEILESILKSNTPVIIESNFSAKLSSKIFSGLINRYNYYPIQIRCITEGETLVKRFKERSNSKDRYPGHSDKEAIKSLEKFLLKGTIEPLDIGGELIDFDTTDLNNIDYSTLFKKVKDSVENRLGNF